MILSHTRTCKVCYLCCIMNLPCVKGAVHHYCFDVKPFNLSACFIMKCDMKCYDYILKMVGHEQQCTRMYEL